MLFINIFLAMLSLTATLTAFGGETWKKGDEPLAQRITKRGYVSLLCLFLIFTLGIIKEIIINQQKASASNENKKLLGEINSLKDSLSKSSTAIVQSSQAVQDKVEDFKNYNCEGLEEAFRLAVNIPREYDDNVVHLQGQEKILVPGRITDAMELYWGDDFEVTFLVQDEDITAQQLSSIKLSVTDKLYDLHPNTEDVYYHGDLRIYGSSPNPMQGYILNPLKLSGVTIKIFVRSTDATRGQENFKKVVLNGQCSEIAKRVYKAINTDIVRLRSQPNDNSQIRSTLTKGSFIKTLQIIDEWSEVITPENRQGWIKTDLLSEIKN